MSLHLAALDRGVMDPAPARYATRIHGHLGATALSAFPALESATWSREVMGRLLLT
jgi:hypothetical protein